MTDLTSVSLTQAYSPKECFTGVQLLTGLNSYSFLISLPTSVLSAACSFVCKTYALGGKKKEGNRKKEKPMTMCFCVCFRNWKSMESVFNRLFSHNEV